MCAEEEEQTQLRNGRFDACVELATALSDREAMAEDVNEEDDDDEEDEAKQPVAGRQMDGVAPEAMQVCEEVQPPITMAPIPSPLPVPSLLPPIPSPSPVSVPQVIVTIRDTSSAPPLPSGPVVRAAVASVSSSKPSPVPRVAVAPLRRRIPKVKAKLPIFSRLLQDVKREDQRAKKAAAASAASISQPLLTTPSLTCTT